jgi:hypothetical protein
MAQVGRVVQAQKDKVLDQAQVGKEAQAAWARVPERALVKGQEGRELVV